MQDSIKKLRDKLADQQRMMKLAEAQVDKVKRLELEITKIKEAKVCWRCFCLCQARCWTLLNVRLCGGVFILRWCFATAFQVRLIRQQKEAAIRHREL